LALALVAAFGAMAPNKSSTGKKHNIDDMGPEANMSANATLPFLGW
jgi:hypothetical protein